MNTHCSFLSPQDRKETTKIGYRLLFKKRELFRTSLLPLFLVTESTNVRFEFKNIV